MADNPTGNSTGNTSLTSAAISGGAGILGSIIGNIGARKRQKKADKANIKFWQMQNAYNDPVQQMARLKKAGLNPNLIYGQSVSGATGQAGAVAPSKAAPYSMDLGTAANNAMSAYQTQANVDKTEIETNYEMFKLGVDKEYLREMAEVKLQDQRLGNARKVIENNVASQTMLPRVLKSFEDYSIARATLDGIELKNAGLQFLREAEDMNISGSSWFTSAARFLAGTAKDANTGFQKVANNIRDLLPKKKQVIKKKKIFKY